MRGAEWIEFAFFSLLTGVAGLRSWEPPRRGRALAIGGVGLGITLTAQFGDVVMSPLAASVIRDWLPAPLMLMAYWQAGRMTEGTAVWFQQWLSDLDRAWFGDELREGSFSHSSSWLTVYLELCYLACYPFVPFALGALYLAQMGRYADEFWRIVLPPTYVCYALVPLLPHLPPRMVLGQRVLDTQPGKIRALNLWILRRAGIQVNTFPSAHVAATLAASLALFHWVPWAGVVFLGIAISIALGAVVLGYHYAADALAAAVLVIAVFLLETYLLR